METRATTARPTCAGRPRASRRSTASRPRLARGRACGCGGSLPYPKKVTVHSRARPACAAVRVTCLVQVLEVEQRSAFNAVVAVWPTLEVAAKANGVSPAGVADAVAMNRMLQGCRWGAPTASGLRSGTWRTAVDERGQRVAQVRTPALCRAVPVAPFIDQPPPVCQAGVPRCCSAVALQPRLGVLACLACLPRQPACLPA